MDYHPQIIVNDIRQMTDDEWKKKRRIGIGGSDCPKILGISSFATRKDLYWDKRGIAHETTYDSEEDNWVAKEVGNRLEDLVLEIFQKKNKGWKVYQDWRMYRHPYYPWMIADIDAVTRDPRTGKIFLIEIKTCSVEALDKWGPKNSNILPPEYEAQGRHYMSVMNIDGVIFICLAGNNESGYRQRFIIRDMKKEQALIRAEADFWNGYVMKGIEPPLNNLDNAKMVIESLNRHYKTKPERKELPDAFRGNLEGVLGFNEQIKNLNQQIKKMKYQRDKMLAPVIDYLQGCEGVIQMPYGKCYVTYSERNTSSIKSDDLQPLMMEYPEVYESYVTNSSSITWKVKKERKETE